MRAPRTADLVLPFSDAPGGAALLATTANVLAPTFTLPRNIEGAYLDVIAQSQSSDELWFTCVPDDVADDLFSCPGALPRRARGRRLIRSTRSPQMEKAFSGR